MPQYHPDGIIPVQDVDPCGSNDVESKRLCDKKAIENMVKLVLDALEKCKVIDHQAMPAGMQAMNETMRMLEINNATSAACQNVIHFYLGQNWTLVPQNTTKVFLVK